MLKIALKIANITMLFSIESHEYAFTLFDWRYFLFESDYVISLLRLILEFPIT